VTGQTTTADSPQCRRSDSLDVTAGVRIPEDGFASLAEAPGPPAVGSVV
jgi:hypothetical protein